jgi:hypothetical protein
MSSRSQKWSSERKFMLAFVVGALVVSALTACNAGFKTKLDDKKAGKPETGAGSTPVATTSVPAVKPTFTSGTSNPYAISPLLEHAAAQSPEIAKIIADAPDKSKIQVTATVGFALIGLSPSNSYSGTGSVLYITVKAQLGTSSAETLLLTNKAQMLVSAPAYVEINGFWTLESAGKQPLVFTLESVINALNGTFSLQGKISMNYDGTDYGSEQIATFTNIPLCQVIVDTSWLSQFYQSQDNYPLCK